MIVKRQVIDTLRKRLKAYPAVALLGPRQSGKTTFVLSVFNRSFWISSR